VEVVQGFWVFIFGEIKEVVFYPSDKRFPQITAEKVADGRRF
jgi:hypothetical protein